MNLTPSVLIAPDIFGHTPALDRLAEALTACPQWEGGKPKIEIIDPYDSDPDHTNPKGNRRFFRQEEAAYDYFTTHSSIPAYSQKIFNHLARRTEGVILVGFSAGASAVWHLSGRGQISAVTRAVGFYGSQIRHYPDITPCFDIHLIFPKAETHFSVDRLIQDLSPTHRVSCEKAPGHHGFMNEYSRNYDPKLYPSWLCACTRMPPLNPDRTPHEKQIKG